jgi:hypothetical protein
VKFRSAGLCAPLLAAVFAIVLTPASVLADANPNNHGHHYHYGWVNHHSPLPAPAPAPAPQPGGGSSTSGPHNSFVAVVPADLAGQAPAGQAPAVVPPEAPVVAPLPDVVPTAQPVLAGPNAWLVAILLATLVAANVTLLVLAASRGGHYALRRTLAPVGIRV